MKYVVSNVEGIKNVFQILNGLVSEARIKFDGNGLIVQAMDPANVCMMMVRVGKENFISVEGESEDVCLNITELCRVLKRVSDSMIFSVVDNKFVISSTNKKNNKVFSLPIIDFEGNEQKKPELNHTNVFSLSSKELRSIIDDMSVSGETVLFETNNDLVINSSGDNIKSEIKTKVPDLEGKENVKSKFSIEYLKKMVISDKISDNVKVSLSTDYPIQLEYEKNNINVTFILTPRVSDD